MFGDEPPLAREVGGKVLDVALRQVRDERGHDRVLACAQLVVLQRLDEVRRVLAAELGNVIDLRERGMLARNAVAAGAHRGLALAGCRVAFRRQRAATGHERTHRNDLKQ